MPFQKILCRNFTASSIRTNSPALPGVYGLSNSREWIFIGMSDNIQRTLLEHLQAEGTAVSRRAPSGFVYEVCYSEQQQSRCDRLIAEYRPACNG